MTAGIEVEVASELLIFDWPESLFYLIILVRDTFCSTLNIVVFSGEAAPETVAEGPDMVIWEFSKNFWQPNAGWCFT